MHIVLFAPYYVLTYCKLIHFATYTEKFSRLKFKLLSKTLGHRVLKDAVAENFNDILLNNRRSYLNGREN